MASWCSLPRVNDIATGIALMLLGMGLAFYLGKPLMQPQAAQLPAIDLGFWSDSPAVRSALKINVLLPIGLVLALVMAWGFARTRAGLLVRLAGDSATATRALGYSVNGIRIAATAAGGLIAGLGGASLTLFYPGSWNEGISSGQGLIAVALVIFARWSPLRCVYSALLFGGAGAIGPALQSIGIGWGYHLFNILPYVLTLLILVITCRPGTVVRGAPGNCANEAYQSLERKASVYAPHAAQHLNFWSITMTTGLGGLNKSKHGVVVGLVQLKLPVVETPAQLAEQTRHICDMVAKARRNQGTMDLVVFPEYALHGLSMSIAPELMVSLDGPEVTAFQQACVDHRIWGCFSIMETNPHGNPYNSGLIIDDTGAIRLYYRKLHPWVPVEPWEPGNLGVPVCDGPNGSKLSLIICHDGMFPEMAREAAYRGAEIILRTAGYTAPIRHAWRITNQSNAFQNLAITASVCLSGSDGSFDSMGEGMFCQFDGTVLAEGGGRVDEIITARVDFHKDLVREARTGWGVENNIYQLYHRGYVAVKGGAQDCPYTYMRDMAAGTYHLPWKVDVTDGSGFALLHNRPYRSQRR